MKRIELPDTVTARLVERTYARVYAIKRMSTGNAREREVAKMLRTRGVNMARARSPRMLLFLEKGYEYLRQESAAQADRYEKAGLATAPEFSECSTWRTAYEKAVEPRQDEQCLHEVFGWIYAAVAEAVG